jgi:HNH endonuclease
MPLEATTGTGVGDPTPDSRGPAPAGPGRCPSLPLDVGRASRVVHPAQRTALAVRDGGCVFPGCDRPLEWCEAHHLLHWLDGGPTDLANLALLCRAHHRAVHEGGWRLIRGPDGRLTPPHRSDPTEDSPPPERRATLLL